jgi:hypothetical protein
MHAMMQAPDAGNTVSGDLELDTLLLLRKVLFVHISFLAATAKVG